MFNAWAWGANTAHASNMANRTANRFVSIRSPWGLARFANSEKRRDCSGDKALVNGAHVPKIVLVALVSLFSFPTEP